MAYFSALGGTGGTSATITVTYSEDFYGVTITATNGTTTLTKTATSSGTLTFDVSEGGTWVVSGTVEGATYSEQVDVFFEYTVPPLVALPDGSTALPVNDIQMWLKCAGIRDKTTYTTLADVLADTDTFIALCADSNASDYMARSTTWASGVAADSTAMLIVGKYNYCAKALLDDNTWETAIRNSPYSDYVNPNPSAGYIPLVPKMTSATTPSGEVTASGEYSSVGRYAWKAFDGSTIGDTDQWHVMNVTSGWIAYKFPQAILANAARIMASPSSYGSRIKDFQIIGSNDDFATTDILYSGTMPNEYANVTWHTYTFTDNTVAYRSYKVNVLNTYDTQSNIGAIEIQFYRKSDLPIIHSAVEDSIFYMDDGSPVALCGIPVGDTIDVDLEAYKGQTLTLVSTVAKDPTNLSNDFSMNVRITPNITEIYLMPYGVFYWYGSEVENNKGTALASNLTDLSRVAPTVTRNKNTMVITEPNGRGEVYWNKYVGLVDAHVIYSATAQANPYTNAVVFSTTALPDYVQADWDDNYAIYMISANESSISLTHKNSTIKDRTYIKAWMTNNSANAETVTLHALWLE